MQFRTWTDYPKIIKTEKNKLLKVRGMIPNSGQACKKYKCENIYIMT